MDELLSHIGISTPSDIDEAEFLPHLRRHAGGEAGEFFPDILHKRSTAPAPHLLDFHFRESRKGKGIGPAAAKGVCVNSLDWGALRPWVVQCSCGPLEGVPNILVRDVVPFFFHKVGREERSPLRGALVPDVYVAAAEGTDWTEVQVPICLVVYANSLPTVLLVVELEGGAISREYSPCWSSPTELTESSLLILLEERNVSQSKLGCLLGFVSGSLDVIFAYTEEVVENDESPVTYGLYELSCSRL